MLGKGVNRMIQNLMYTDRGRFLLSIIFGLGVATLFRAYCKGRNCYNFIGPKQNEIRDKIFSFDSANEKCYTMREKNVKCGTKEQTIHFAEDEK